MGTKAGAPAPGPKQHHIVNQSYLELFRCPDRLEPAIWMCDLREGRILPTQPFSVAKRAHYYSFVDENGERAR